MWPVSHNGTADKAEQLVMSGEGARVMAVNGWVMGDDPLKNFAEEGRDKVLTTKALSEPYMFITACQHTFLNRTAKVINLDRMGVK